MIGKGIVVIRISFKLQLLIKYYFPVLYIFSSLYGQHEIGLKVKYNTPRNFIKTNFNLDDNIGNGIYSWLKVDLGSFIYVNEMCASTYIEDMERGAVKKLSGVYGFSNQGYVQFEKNVRDVNHEIIFGRTYINHGFGKYGRLLVSNWSRPFDQMAWKVKYRGVNAQVVVSELNNRESVKRYFTLHTIDFQINDDLIVSFGESCIYAGENRGIELQYINPTLLWVPIRENQIGNYNQTNAFWYFGVKNQGRFLNNWFEFLLDDYQIDSEVHEPTTFGITFGFDFKNFSKKVFDKYAMEYTRIANRTYQTAGSLREEDYLHRNYPIGYYLGNNFDIVTATMEFRTIDLLKFQLLPNLSLSHKRAGDDGISSIWSAPWEDSNNLVNGLYKEKFPSGPVSYGTEIKISSILNMKENSYIESGILFNRKELKNRIEFDNFIFFRFLLAFNYDFIY